MKQHPIDFSPPLCTIDPVTITALAIGGIGLIAGGAAASAMAPSSGGSQAPTPTPSAPPQTPAPQAAPATERPKAKSTTPSFIGGAAVPDSRSFGSKTLLGQ